MQVGRRDRRPGEEWRSRSARWPRSARLATCALVALIGLTLLGAALGEDRTEARTTGPAATSTSTTAAPARSFTSEVMTSPSTSTTTTTTLATTTTEAPTTTTPPAPTTTWASPPTEPPGAPAGAPVGGYANCAAARAAGAAPVHVGEPGYAPRLDGDGDGVGCE